MQISTHKQAEKAPAGRHSVPSYKGLYLLVSASGQRRWVYRYTKPTTGKVTEAGLGGFDVLGLADARDVANDHRKALKGKGKVDPIEAKRAAKAERLAQQRAAITFGEVATDYIAEKASGWSENHCYNVHLLLTRHAKALANKPLAAITSDDIVATLNPMRKHAPNQERRALTAISLVFQYAEAREIFDGRNPAEWSRMKKRYPSAPKIDKHHRALDYREVPAFVTKLRNAQTRDSAPFALEFLLLTAVRLSECTDMTWSEVDLQERLWTVPAERTKTRKPHAVPLSDRCAALLKRQAATRSSEFVWPGRRDNPIGDRTLYMCLTSSLGIKSSLHGLRATFRTWAGEKTEAAWETIEACLAHTVGSGVARAYWRGDALDKRRELMAEWATYCGGAAVVGLPSPAPSPSYA